MPGSDCREATMTTRQLVVALVLAFASVFCTHESKAETIECVLKPHARNVAAIDENTKASIATLNAGDRIYQRFPDLPEAWHFIIRGGRFVEITALSSKLLDCDTPREPSEYPIVLQGAEG